MRTALLAALLAAALSPLPSRADPEVAVRLVLPGVPALVAIGRSIEVVEGHDDEIFYHSGWFWLRRGPRWYQARTPHAAFAPVDVRHVPHLVRSLPEGRYVRYRADRKELRREWKEEEHRERREAKEREKAERRARRDQEKAERHREHRGHGEGREKHD